MTARFEIVFPGTGSPLPGADRRGAGNVIVPASVRVPDFSKRTPRSLS